MPLFTPPSCHCLRHTSSTCFGRLFFGVSGCSPCLPIEGPGSCTWCVQGINKLQLHEFLELAASTGCSPPADFGDKCSEFIANAADHIDTTCTSQCLEVLEATVTSCPACADGQVHCGHVQFKTFTEQCADNLPGSKCRVCSCVCALCPYAL